MLRRYLLNLALRKMQITSINSNKTKHVSFYRFREIIYSPMTHTVLIP